MQQSVKQRGGSEARRPRRSAPSPATDGVSQAPVEVGWGFFPLVFSFGEEIIGTSGGDETHSWFNLHYFPKVIATCCIVFWNWGRERGGEVIVAVDRSEITLW